MESVFLHLSFSQGEPVCSSYSGGYLQPLLLNGSSPLLTYMRVSRQHEEARMAGVSSEELSRGSRPQMMGVMWNLPLQ